MVFIPGPGFARGFRNVGKPKSDAGEIPKRIHTIFKTRRKFEIKNAVFMTYISLIGLESQQQAGQPEKYVLVLGLSCVQNVFPNLQKSSED